MNNTTNRNPNPCPPRRGFAKTWLVVWLAVSAGLLGRSLWRGESPAPEVASRGTADAVGSLGTAKRHAFRAIEQLRVGDRVVSDNPDVASPAQTAVDPSMWRLVTLYAEQTWADGTLDTIHIRTLQPPEWIDHWQAAVGVEVTPPLDLVEMGLPDDLLTRVVKVEPCPPLEPPLPGDEPGRLVLTTVNHLNADVWELSAEPIRGPPGETRTLEPTGSHRFYSETRGEWVATNELETGEVIRGRGGALRVTRAWPQPGVQRVYNLTFEGEHAYYVGEYAALAHNNCIRLGLKETDFKSFHRRGLTTDDLDRVDDPSDFLVGIRQALGSRNLKGVTFSLDNINPSRTADQFGSTPIFDQFNGNITARELQALLGQTTALKNRGVPVRFELGGTVYDSFEDAISPSVLRGDLTREQLDVFIEAIR